MAGQGYDARTRATLCCVAGELQVPWELIARAEDALASKLALTVLQVNADRLRSRYVSADRSCSIALEPHALAALLVACAGRRHDIVGLSWVQQG